MTQKNLDDNIKEGKKVINKIVKKKGWIMKKTIMTFCLIAAGIIFLSGCSTTGSKKEVAKSKVATTDAELIDIKMKQLLAEKAIQAANEAVKAANLASEKAIAIANQTMAEVNRLRATVKMQEEVEPILKEEPQVPVEQKTHIVKQGETLSSIAYKYYKDSSRWKVLYDANKNILKTPDTITPGTKLVIP